MGICSLIYFQLYRPLAWLGILSSCSGMPALSFIGIGGRMDTLPQWRWGGKPWWRYRQPSAADSWQGAGRMSLRWGVGGPPHKCKTICPVSRLVLAIFSGNDSAAACTRISAKHLIFCHSAVWVFLTSRWSLMRMPNGPFGPLKWAVRATCSGSVAFLFGLFGRVTVALLHAWRAQTIKPMGFSVVWSRLATLVGAFRQMRFCWYYSQRCNILRSPLSSISYRRVTKCMYSFPCQIPTVP